jgi:hypothetical protein
MRITNKDIRVDLYAKPSLDMSEDLQAIYEHFNKRLFEFRLPNCMITLKPYKGSGGYFSIGSYDRRDGKKSDEITINPLLYCADNPKDFLAIFVHQMVHIDQHHFGNPGRGVYHNREFAEKMLEIGLQPSKTGEEGGRETGDTIHQIVIAGGVFEKAADELDIRSQLLTWRNISFDLGKAKNSSKSGKHANYVCPSCGLLAQSRHGVRIACVDDGELMLARV